MRTRFALIAVLLFGAASCVLGQRMEEQDGDPNPFIKSIREASANDARHFPVMSAADPNGALVVASGDFHNSDITIIVEKSQLNDLKARVMALVAKLHLPDTFIRVRRARVIGSFDLEFNKYIREDGNHSSSTVPLGTVVDEVRKWPLPAPLGVAISGSEYLDLSFRGEKVGTMKLIQPDDILASDVVNVSVDRHWYGRALLCLMDVLVTLGFGLLVWRIFTASFDRQSFFGWLFVPRTAGSTRKWFQLEVLPSKGGWRFAICYLAWSFTPHAWVSDIDSWIPAHPLHLGPLMLLVLGVPFVTAVVFRILTRGANLLGEKPAWFRKAFLLVLMPTVLWWAISQAELFAPNWLFATPAPTVTWWLRIIGTSSLFSIAVGTVAYLRLRGSKLC